MPAEAHDSEPVAEQPRISWVFREIPVAAVDQRDNAPPPAVGDFQKHRTVTLFRVLRTDGVEVGRELDLSVLEIHRVAEIDDAEVVRIGDSE